MGIGASRRARRSSGGSRRDGLCAVAPSAVPLPPPPPLRASEQAFTQSASPSAARRTAAQVSAAPLPAFSLPRKPSSVPRLRERLESRGGGEAPRKGAEAAPVGGTAADAGHAAGSSDGSGTEAPASLGASSPEPQAADIMDATGALQGDDAAECFHDAQPEHPSAASAPADSPTERSTEPYSDVGDSSTGDIVAALAAASSAAAALLLATPPGGDEDRASATTPAVAGDAAAADAPASTEVAIVKAQTADGNPDCSSGGVPQGAKYRHESGERSGAIAQADDAAAEETRGVRSHLLRFGVSTSVATAVVTAGYDLMSDIADFGAEDVGELERFTGVALPPGHRKRLLRAAMAACADRGLQPTPTLPPAPQLSVSQGAALSEEVLPGAIASPETTGAAPHSATEGRGEVLMSEQLVGTTGSLPSESTIVPLLRAAGAGELPIVGDDDLCVLASVDSAAGAESKRAALPSMACRMSDTVQSINRARGELIARTPRGSKVRGDGTMARLCFPSDAVTLANGPIQQMLLNPNAGLYPVCGLQPLVVEEVDSDAEGILGGDASPAAAAAAAVAINRARGELLERTGGRELISTPALPPPTNTRHGSDCYEVGLIDRLHSEASVARAIDEAFAEARGAAPTASPLGSPVRSTSPVATEKQASLRRKESMQAADARAKSPSLTPPTVETVTPATDHAADNTPSSSNADGDGVGLSQADVMWRQLLASAERRSRPQTPACGPVVAGTAPDTPATAPLLDAAARVSTSVTSRPSSARASMPQPALDALRKLRSSRASSRSRPGTADSSSKAMQPQARSQKTKNLKGRKSAPSVVHSVAVPSTVAALQVTGSAKAMSPRGRRKGGRVASTTASPYGALPTRRCAVTAAASKSRPAATGSRKRPPLHQLSDGSRRQNTTQQTPAGIGPRCKGGEPMVATEVAEGKVDIDAVEKPEPNVTPRATPRSSVDVLPPRSRPRTPAELSASSERALAQVSQLQQLGEQLQARVRRAATSAAAVSHEPSVTVSVSRSSVISSGSASSWMADKMRLQGTLERRVCALRAQVAAGVAASK